MRHIIPARPDRVFLASIVLLAIALSVRWSPAFAGSGAPHSESAASFQEGVAKRILIVLTSHGTLGETGRSTGANGLEIAEAYDRFTQAGYALEFASPAGGLVPLEQLDATRGAILERPELVTALATTLRLDQIDASRFCSLYIAGGHGALWDLPQQASLQRMIRTILAAGGVVGAVGQGTAALIDVKLADGTYLLAGRTATGSSNAEEATEGCLGFLPFALQTILAARGASWNASAPFKPNVIVSRRLVTGQNASSASGVVHFMLQLLEKNAVQSGSGRG